MEMRRTKNKRKSIDNCGHHSTEIDRLGSLPDNLLITILSLLPLMSAATTSILSRRWRYLWTHITHVSLQGCRYDGEFIRLKNSKTTIDHIISKLTSPKIHTFDIYLLFDDRVQAFEYLVQLFEDQVQPPSSLLISNIHKICLRNPEVIKIGSGRSSLCHLSTSIFKTQSLVELELTSNFKFDFPSDDQIIINMPKLKKLTLSLCDSHRRFMHTLFKSCPLLESLCLFLNLMEEDHHVDILAPELKFLSIVTYCCNCMLLLIDAPKLVHLKTHGSFCTSVFYQFVKKLRCLQEADIIISRYHVSDGNDYRAKILSLFQGISCARFLTFNRCFLDHLLVVALPIFHNLVHLSIEGFDISSSSRMPSCLLSNVKHLKIVHMEPNEYGIKFLRDILSNAAVLEKLQVSLHKYGNKRREVIVWKDYAFIMKLFKLPRSSSSCQIEIELSGRVITASSEHFEYDQLTCHLRDSTYGSDSG